MAFDIKYEIVKNDSVLELAHSQLVVTCSINTAERGGVTRVLGVSADARLFSLEALEGVAKLSGKVNYKILYLDGEGKLSGLDYFSDFSDKIESGSIKANYKLNAQVSVIDVDTSVSGEEITLSAVCDFVIETVVTKEYKTVSDINAEYEIKEQIISKIVPSESVFEVCEEVESGANIDKVLLYHSRVIALESTVTEAGVMLKGEASSDIIYLAEGKIYTKTAIIPFSEELNVQKSEKVTYSAKIKNSRLVLSGEEDNNILRIELLIVATGKVFVTDSINVLTDLFSEESEIAEEKTIVDNTVYEFSKWFEASISTEATLEENMQPVAKVVATPVSRNILANLIVGADTITAEGLIVANVLYLDEEENVGSVQVELPYSVALSAEGVTDKMILKGETVAACVTAKSKGSQIEVKAELKLRADIYTKQQLHFVTSITEGEKKAETQAGISIYFAEESDTVWSIAKALNVSPKRLIKNNPQLADGVAKGTRIIIFREKNI